jgi:hypothetical protein
MPKVQGLFVLSQMPYAVPFSAQIGRPVATRVSKLVVVVSSYRYAMMVMMDARLAVYAAKRSIQNRIQRKLNSLTGLTAPVLGV